MASLVLILSLASSVALNALAQVALRMAMRKSGFELSSAWALRQLASPAFLSGMLCYAVSLLLWLYVLSRIQVSLAYPFHAGGYILAAIVAWRFLGESPTWLNLLGMALIFLGLLCLSVGIAGNE